MNNIRHTARSLFGAGFLFLLILVAAACGGGQTDGENSDSGTRAADAPPTAGTALAGVAFDPPSEWTDLGPSGMRQAQYQLPAVAGDRAPAEVNVFYFGPASGGGVEANLQRWIDQMVLPEGADPSAAAERGTFTADGMNGHIVSLNGSYKSGGGRPMAGGGEVLPGYRLVGVVVEGPQGSLFFKLTGPLATVQTMEPQLLAMVKTARKQG